MIDLWSASSGRVILAHLPDEEVDSYFANVPLPTGMNEQTVREDLETIREKGYEVRDSFVVRGIVNVSAPIIDHSGRAVAAMTIPHIERYHDTLTFEDCRRELVDTARALTRSLGGGASEGEA